jgi:Swt1-like HEPN
MQAVSQQYAPRRTHIKNEFYALVNSLYGAETMADAIADIVQQVDFGQLNLLPQDIQDKGREMSDVYLYLYCIENSLRIFIAEIMNRETVTIPTKVQATITKMKESEQERKYLPVRGDNDLFYCDFIELGKIIVSNWAVFGQYFPNKNDHWVNVMVGELYQIRCLVAHNSFVGEHERQSLKVYYKNITLQLKL